MLQAAKKGFLNATELADYLALKEIAFREAHCIVGKIVRYCIEKSQNLEDLSLEEVKNFSPLFSSDVFDVLDLKRIVNAKNSQGGTAKFQVEKQLATISLSLTKTGSWIAEKKQLILPQLIEDLS